MNVEHVDNYICRYICVYIYICMCLYINIYSSVCIYVCVCVCIEASYFTRVLQFTDGTSLKVFTKVRII